jgi:hypothetical protein
MPQSAKYALGVAAAAALLAGCSSGATSSFAPAAGGSAAGAAKFVHNGHVLSTSVLSPKAQARLAGQIKVSNLQVKPLSKVAKGTQEIFISDAYADQVYVFTSAGSYVGTLPQPTEGFSEPQGLCSDTKGNLFVSNTANSTVDQYAGGKFKAALSDPGYYPVSCAVDPKTNTLAVGNIISTSGGQGGITLYANETGTGTQKTDPNMYEVYFTGYYAKTGNLYYSGDNIDFYPALSSYSNKGKFKLVTLKGATLGFAGTVTYSTATKSLAVGDQDTFSSPTFYHVKGNGNVTGQTVTNCPSGDCDIVQATVHGKTLIGADAAAITAEIFPWPAGGNATKTLTGASFEQPLGTAEAKS